MRLQNYKLQIQALFRRKVLRKNAVKNYKSNTMATLIILNWG